MFVITSYFVRV